MFLRELNQRSDTVLQALRQQENSAPFSLTDNQHIYCVDWKEPNHHCFVWSQWEWSEGTKCCARTDTHTHTLLQNDFSRVKRQLLGLTCRFYGCLSHNLPMMHFICTWWVFNCIYNSIWNSCKHDCNAALSCSPFPLLFRVLLCTAHMQACTVIRFSLLRFVPLRELLSDCRATAIPADRGAKHLSCSFSLLSLCLELKRLLNSYLFFLQHLFSWTLDSRLTADLWFPTYVTDALLALTLIHSMSSSLFFLYPLSLFSPLSFLFITGAPLCIVDGFPQNWPRLSLSRADQQLSETLSEGRPQLKGMCAFSFVSLTL